MLAEESLDLLKYLIGAGGFSGGLLTMYFLQWQREKGAFGKLNKRLEEIKELLIEVNTKYEILAQRGDH